MRLILLALTVVLCFCHVGNAQQKYDRQTIKLFQAFTRRAAKCDNKHMNCVHTQNLADKHLQMWRNWNRTRRWPQLASRNYVRMKPKANATSVVRISWYLYEDSTHEIEADNFGRVGVFGARYDMGPYETKAFWLKPAQMNRVQRLLRQLPPIKKVTNWKDVLFVSGRINNRWSVRTYSRKQKPRAISELLQILTPKIKE